VAITWTFFLPEVDGWEVLSRLKADETTRNIPVGRSFGRRQRGVRPRSGAFDYSSNRWMAKLSCPD